MKSNLDKVDQTASEQRVIEREPTEHHIKTRYSNIWVDTRESIWTPDGKKPVNVGAAREDVAPSLHHGLEALLRHYVSRVAAGTLSAYLAAIRHYRQIVFGTAPISRWHIDDLTNYRNKLVKQVGHEENLIKLRAALKTWCALRLPGVDLEVVEALESWRLKGMEIGRAVRRMDPESGPLLPQEYGDLDAGVFRGSEMGVVNLADLCLYILHAYSGRRAEQTCSLKCLDIDPDRFATPDANGAQFADIPIHRIPVPRAKQHGADWRASFRDITLPGPQFNFLHAQRLSVQAKFLEAIDRHDLGLSETFVQQLLPQLPLFPSWIDVDQSLKAAQSLLKSGPITETPVPVGMTMLIKDAQSRQWHTTGSDIYKRLRNIVKVVDARGREGNPLNLNPRRLRYTKGTNLARLGASVEVIAWLLDHSGIQTVNVYTDNLPEHAAAINEALKGSWRLQLVARMFRGEVVQSEANAVGGDHPHASRIHFQGIGAATCGVNKACGLGGGIPLACYTCNNFQPWLDGPHEKVLSHLLQQRLEKAQALGETHPLTTRQDKTIVSVINVLQRCEAIRQHAQKAQTNESSA